jgi:aspartyl-tRNA(Asn)/glutamyl-tRNA(Gln) amidotransferase subunit C
MSDITREVVRKLAGLSRIDIHDDELDHFQKELETILTYIDQLQSIDTEGIEPTYQVSGLSNKTRIDHVYDYGTEPDELLKNSPHRQDDFIKVQRMVG